MKKFILKIALFFGILIVIDIILGSVFLLYDYSQSGNIHKIHSIMTTETPDILIMGSSRASHHYDTHILSDALTMQVFNAGMDGHGVPLAYGILKGLEHRNFPKLIIYEMWPNFDIYESESNLSVLYPYINIYDIRNELISFNKNEKFFLLSNSYKLNSKLWEIILSLRTSKESNKNGYIPLFGYMKHKEQLSNKSIITKQRNSLKEKYLRKFIEDAHANGSKIIFTISPIYDGDISSFRDEIAIVKEYKVPILDHSEDSEFLYNRGLFQDKTHLNDHGAKLYSTKIAKELKDYM